MRIPRLFIVALLSLSATLAGADGYQARNIRVIAPYTPGGTSDTLARAIGLKLHDAWGEPVVVENRPGPTATSVPISSPGRRRTVTRCC